MKSSFVPPLARPIAASYPVSVTSSIGSVRIQALDTGMHRSVEKEGVVKRAGLMLRVIQREKKSGSSIMQPHNLNCPSIVVV